MNPRLKCGSGWRAVAAEFRATQRTRSIHSDVTCSVGAPTHGITSGNLNQFRFRGAGGWVPFGVQVDPSGSTALNHDGHFHPQVPLRPGGHEVSAGWHSYHSGRFLVVPDRVEHVPHSFAV